MTGDYQFAGSSRYCDVSVRKKENRLVDNRLNRLVDTRKKLAKNVHDSGRVNRRAGVGTGFTVS